MEKDVVLPFQAKKEESSFLIYSSLHKEAIPKIENILRSFRELKKKYKYLKLHIFGDGSGKQELENDIERLGLKDTVYLHGRASHAETYYYKQICRFYISINPSVRNIYHILENSKLETISVLVDNEISKEYIRDGENGVIFTYFNFQEKVTSLLGDSDRKSNIIRVASLELTSKYSVQNHIKEIIKVYES
jgi:glycosyltransferase involved in cell wall biosynthesis